MNSCSMSTTPISPRSGLLNIGLSGLNTANLSFAISAERLATGLQINRGSDDPAGLIASQKLEEQFTAIESQIGSLQRSTLDLNIEAADASVERQAEIGMQQRSNEAMELSLQEQQINTARAQSSIQDTDYAKEISEMARASILGKASMRVILIGNQQAESVLDLLA